MTKGAPQATADRLAEAAPPRPVLKFGLYVGLAMVAEMAIALVVINRVAALERYALERNALLMVWFLILMLVPVCRFLRSPVRMFASSMLAWAIFVVGYDLAGIYFDHLFNILHHWPLEVLVEGAVLYGICAVGSWVVEMIVHAYRHSITPARRSARATRHAR